LQTGGPLDLKNIAARHFKPLLKAFYQLPDIRLYDLRHTHASILLALGTQPHVVAKRLGHASPMMTLNVYAHVLSGQHDDTVAKLEAYMEMQRA
jgi:integrase